MGSSIFDKRYCEKEFFQCFKRFKDLHRGVISLVDASLGRMRVGMLAMALLIFFAFARSGIAQNGDAPTVLTSAWERGYLLLCGPPETCGTRD
jgi:hypothetical protein